MANPLPSFVSEKDLNKRFGTFGFLASGGRYGCGAVLFEGDLVDERGALLFSDEWFHDLNDQHPNDVGTVLVTGNVRSKRKLFVSCYLSFQGFGNSGSPIRTRFSRNGFAVSIIGISRRCSSTGSAEHLYPPTKSTVPSSHLSVDEGASFLRTCSAISFTISMRRPAAHG